MNSHCVNWSDSGTWMVNVIIAVWKVKDFYCPSQITVTNCWLPTFKLYILIHPSLPVIMDIVLFWIPSFPTFRDLVTEFSAGIPTIDYFLKLFHLSVSISFTFLVSSHFLLFLLRVCFVSPLQDDKCPDSCPKTELLTTSCNPFSWMLKPEI